MLGSSDKLALPAAVEDLLDQDTKWNTPSPTLKASMRNRVL